MVADVNDVRNQTLLPRALPTRWLLPASLAEFDARCNVSDIGAAFANNCSLIGTFDSCTSGAYLYFFAKSMLNRSRKEVTFPVHMYPDASQGVDGTFGRKVAGTNCPL